ncbi:class I SAM-dependent methyltransferase [Acidihalobacter ferrooxydans]|uniref:Methyltransferase n=1 Tax=Acidihalobacter ferrooxydans TaxID=1765967 RepID=A0A1P8UKK9_9GAMM|nr:class I SAM-dependent methyltransferase [Acidihalobacter ferrooxydans]APZ44363.1 methyltransferase [Acidihalobacter ferrooxydans]
MNQDTRFPATLMPDKDWWQALWPDPEAVLAGIGVESGMDAVDLCCGDGHFTRALCRLTYPGLAWAIDLDAGLLSQASEGCRDALNFRPILGDARELPDRITSPVDLIFIANTFHGVPDKAGLAATVHRVLKPGGRFAIVNWHRRPREETVVLAKPRGPDTELRMRPEEVREIVEPAGFIQESVADVGPYHYAAVFRTA